MSSILKMQRRYTGKGASFRERRGGDVLRLSPVSLVVVRLVVVRGLVDLFFLAEREECLVERNSRSVGEVDGDVARRKDEVVELGCGSDVEDGNAGLGGGREDVGGGREGDGEDDVGGADEARFAALGGGERIHDDDGPRRRSDVAVVRELNGLADCRRTRLVFFRGWEWGHRVEVAVADGVACGVEECEAIGEADGEGGAVGGEGEGSSLVVAEAKPVGPLGIARGPWHAITEGGGLSPADTRGGGVVVEESQSRVFRPFVEVAQRFVVGVGGDAVAGQGEALAVRREGDPRPKALVGSVQVFLDFLPHDGSVAQVHDRERRPPQEAVRPGARDDEPGPVSRKHRVTNTSHVGLQRVVRHPVVLPVVVVVQGGS
mmetsp:Transcript_20823/g.67044  ORF Transcript_20823/g.67044 Transcript_20823/m.67044 type:complete len:375 (-) Transcript_20823:679-1803(-)